MFIYSTDDPDFDPATAVVVVCNLCEKTTLQCLEVEGFCESCCETQDCSLHPMEY